MSALLIKQGICIQLKNCSFKQTRVELLVLCIDKEGILTDERKVQSIRDAHPPSSGKKY